MAVGLGLTLGGFLAGFATNLPAVMLLAALTMGFAWLGEAANRADARALQRARMPRNGQAPEHLARATIVDGEPCSEGWLATTADTIAFYSSNPKHPVLVIPRAAVLRVDLVALPSDYIKLRFATMTDRIETREIWSRSDIRPLLGWIAPDEDLVPGTVELPRATVVIRDRDDDD